MCPQVDKIALRLTALQAGYGDVVIASIDSLQIAPGEVVAIVGPSGCGKTTLLRTIAGSLPAVAGSIWIDGAAADQSLRQQLTARTLQAFPLLHWLTVEGNLKLAARLRGGLRVQTRELLTEFRAEHLAARFPNELSGGERCRASLAQAVVGSPRVLLLDEPFTGLDTLVKDDVAGSVFEFARAREATVLFITHDLHDAVVYSDRVVVLSSSSPSALFGIVDASCASAEADVRAMLMKSSGS
jgi:NitT/TauT family transport system ATP-binding protein